MLKIYCERCKRELQSNVRYKINNIKEEKDNILCLVCKGESKIENGNYLDYTIMEHIGPGEIAEKARLVLNKATEEYMKKLNI